MMNQIWIAMRDRSVAALLATAIGLAIAAAAPQVATAQSLTARVDSIVIEGEQRIEEATIRSYLDINEGDVVNASQINQALKRLFATGLFKDVRITPRSNGVLFVVVEENPIINAISFEGNKAIKDKVLSGQIRSRVRGAFTRARAEADAQTIVDAYRAAGRYSAVVVPKIIDRGKNRIDLVFEITEGEEVKVSAINFVGNTEYSDRRLRGVVRTTERAWWRFFGSNDNYSPDRLEYDKELLRRYYFARGYADFEVLSAVADLNAERSGFFITFTVKEGEQYTNGEVNVVSEVDGVDAALFEPLVKTYGGDTYDADLVRRTIKKMQGEAGRQGINFITVKPTAKKRRGPNDEPIIDLTYRIVSAPRVYVERIEISGNDRTLDRVIRREFTFVEGDAFNAYRLQESKENVRRLGFFKKVDVKTKRGSASDRVVVVTKVKEQSTGDISFGVGYSTSDSVGGTISVTERNFLGRGQYVKASASVSADRQFIDFRFTEPYFLDRNVRAGFDIFHTEIDKQDASSFDIRRTGLRPRVGFPIDEFSFINFSYLIENNEIRGVAASASPLVRNDEGARIISAFAYDYSYDRRNSKTQPTEGFIIKFSQTFAGLGGDAFYVKSESSAKAYTSFFREEVIASVTLRGGALFGLRDDDITVGDRFFLGGDSFRGFENSGVGPLDNNVIGVDTDNNNIDDTTRKHKDALGGNYYAVASADVSFPIGLPEEWGIFGGVFADAGAVWGLDKTTYTAFDGTGTGTLRTFTVDDALKLRVSVGASVFWTSPFGPIRLNFAKPIVKEDTDEEEFFRFTAGSRF